MRLALTTVAIGLIGGTAATAATTPHTARWLTRPSERDIEVAFPPKAFASGYLGAVAIKCRVTVEGVLENCRVIEETPQGFGFGEGALKLTPKMRIALTAPDGRAVSDTIVIPVTFLLPHGTPPKLRIWPGDTAILVTIVQGSGRFKAHLFPCPSSTDPERKCQGHTFKWMTAPDPMAANAALSKVDLASGSSLIQCNAAKDGELTSCQISGNKTPMTEAALLDFARLFKAPPRSDDGSAMSAGKIVIELDWDKLR